MLFFCPAMGDFGFFIQAIIKKKLQDAILEVVYKKKFLFGICVGFQSLFRESEEASNVLGLNFFSEGLTKFSSKKTRVPHIGWEKTYFVKNSLLFKKMNTWEYFYYIHSYCCSKKSQYTIATCQYGIEFTSIVEKENIFGTQFHPEKSGKVGMQLLENFMQIVEKRTC